MDVTGAKPPFLEAREHRHSGEEKTTAEKGSNHQCLRSPQLWEKYTAELYHQEPVSS